MTTQHTPGPWTIAGRALYADDVGYIGEFDINGDSGVANGRLMAAAPELLAALEFARMRIDCACPKPGMATCAACVSDAVIAKAKGE